MAWICPECDNSNSDVMVKCVCGYVDVDGEEDEAETTSSEIVEHEMSDQEPSEEQIVEAVYSLAAEQIKSGASAQQIQSMLVKEGLDPESAATVISNLTQMPTEAIREAGKKNMLYGALWCTGGIVVTVVTYSTASGGGTYFVAWGAIVFGAIQFIRGLMQSGEG